MPTATVSMLAALRDIEGVLGSIVVDADGRILARDLPPLFAPDALTKASLRLARLRAALESAGAGFDSCVARFGPHLFVLRALQEDTLCVLCPEGTNLPAVHMGSTLIARRLTSPGPVVATVDARPQVHAQSGDLRDDDNDDVAATPPTRRFRGRSV